MLTYEQVVQAITAGKPNSAYLLWGEEPLFIDRLAELFATRVVPDSERDLNQTILYGNDKDVDVATIISEALRFPMMGERILVLVRDAHQVRGIEGIAPYLPKLPETTCLVLCYKKKVDKRRQLYAAFDKLGSVYESQHIRDAQVPSFITSSLSARHVQIDQHTAQLMAEHTGNDLEKILGEVDKLSIVLGERGGTVTPELIEEYIGISKEYNNFELLNALIQRDAPRAFRIAHYFAANEKNFPIQMTLPILFRYFSLLMGVYYAPDRSERGVAAQLGLPSPYAARDYIAGAQRYTASGVFSIIRQLRMADAASKGVDANIPSGEILRELVASILAS